MNIPSIFPCQDGATALGVSGVFLAINNRLWSRFFFRISPSPMRYQGRGSTPFQPTKMLANLVPSWGIGFPG